MSESGLDAQDLASAVLQPADADQPAPERLVVARGLFAGPSARVTDDMYARIVRGECHRERHALHLEKGATVDTDTYFGRLPASFFQLWTTVTSVRIKLDFDAVGAARLLLRGSDSHGNARTIASAEIDGSGTATLSAPLNEYLDGGGLWLQCTAVGGPLAITDLEWTVPAPSSIRPAAITMCTFNRGDECAATLAAIASDGDMLAGIDAVYVVDQGTDPVSTRPLFGEVAAELGDKLVYLRQPNLGGSGGFARGLYEVSRIGEHANVILMDDDILVEPEIVLRLNAFANVTSTPTIVGAQMLHLKNPTHLLVGAEVTDLKHLTSGQEAVFALRNADMIRQRQDKRVDAQYNAWWSCLIPAEVIPAIGLPLPMFYQWDDIEYGLRARAAGFPTVTLPNAGVWHADFHWKDRDDIFQYFTARNSLITYALHDDLDTKTTSRWLARQIAACLVSMQYALAYTMIRGVEDFLKGPSALEDGGAAALAAIRADRSAFPETVVHAGVMTGEPANTMPPMKPAGPELPPILRPRRRIGMDLMLAKRLVGQLFGRTIPGPVGIMAVDNHWWHVARFDHAVVTDASQTGVRIRRRDERTLRTLARRAVSTLRMFRKQAPSVQVRYREAFPELASRRNWERLFES